MIHNMPCEPIEEQPEKNVSIGVLETSVEKKDNHDALDDFRQRITYKLESYDVLPLMHDENQRLDVLLSLRNNKYLKFRWDKFVETGSTECFQLRLYRDYKMDLLKKPLSRRKSLSGSFFGADNRLAPLPQPSKQTTLNESHKYKEMPSKAWRF